MSHPSGLTWASRGELVVIRPRGYLDRRLGREVAVLVERRMGHGNRDFLVDLEESDTVNHFGLAELSDLEARLRRADATLRLRGGTPTVRKILRILGLESEAAGGGAAADLRQASGGESGGDRGLAAQVGAAAAAEDDEPAHPAPSSR